MELQYYCTESFLSGDKVNVSSYCPSIYKSVSTPILFKFRVINLVFGTRACIGYTIERSWLISRYISDPENGRNRSGNCAPNYPPFKTLCWVRSGSSEREFDSAAIIGLITKLECSLNFRITLANNGMEQ